MIQVFLSQSPKNPVADEASLALLGAFTDLEDFKSVERWRPGSPSSIPRAPTSTASSTARRWRTSTWASTTGRSRWPRRSPQATYKDAAGVDQPSPNKWQALYILGQIHDARRQPAKALEYYRQVADRFSDAASAVQFYTRKDLKVPEVSVVRPEARPAVRGRPPSATRPGRRLPAVIARPSAAASRAAEPRHEAGDRARLSQHRPGRRQGLSGRPDAALPDPAQPERDRRHRPGRRHAPGREDRRARRRCRLRRQVPVDRLAARQGRGVPDDDPRRQPLRLGDRAGHAARDGGARGARRRPGARDRPRRQTKDFLPKVQVKVIGSDNPQFISGETDLRGVFVAEGVRGQVTAVARQGTAQYAFYRGTTYVGQPVQVPPAPGGAGQAASQPASAGSRPGPVARRQPQDAESVQQL